MARITNEELKRQLDDLLKKLPNGEFRLLKVQMLELQTDVKELLDDQKKLHKRLYNPDSGVVVKLNKNTEYVNELKAIDAIETVKTVDKLRTNYNRLVWAVYAMIIGVILREKLYTWLFGTN